MSWPPPYKSMGRVWKTLRGIERAAERFGGVFKGFDGDALVIEWEGRAQRYRAEHKDGFTELDMQLKYDLEP